MSIIEPLTLNKNPSQTNINIYPGVNQIFEENINFFSPTKVIKLSPITNNIQNIISSNDYRLYSQKINIFPQNNFNYNNANNVKKKTLVLDIDETLVHSSMDPFPNGNHLIININVKGKNYNIYVLKRPFLEQFLQEMSYLYEIIVFTASISEYAEALVKLIDKNNVIKHILNRSHCLLYQGSYIKDLKLINRDIKNLIIIDNNPISYMLNKENGIPILSWYGEPKDNELIKLIPLLKYLAKVDDVRNIINKIIDRKNETDQLKFDVINQIIEKDNHIYNNFNSTINNQNNSFFISNNININNFNNNSPNININNMNNNKNNLKNFNINKRIYVKKINNNDNKKMNFYINKNEKTINISNNNIDKIINNKNNIGNNNIDKISNNRNNIGNNNIDKTNNNKNIINNINNNLFDNKINLSNRNNNIQNNINKIDNANNINNNQINNLYFEKKLQNKDINNDSHKNIISVVNNLIIKGNLSDKNIFNKENNKNLSNNVINKNMSTNNILNNKNNDKFNNTYSNINKKIDNPEIDYNSTLGPKDNDRNTNIKKYAKNNNIEKTPNSAMNRIKFFDSSNNIFNNKPQIKIFQNNINNITNNNNSNNINISNDKDKTPIKTSTVPPNINILRDISKNTPRILFKRENNNVTPRIENKKVQIKFNNTKSENKINNKGISQDNENNFSQNNNNNFPKDNNNINNNTNKKLFNNIDISCDDGNSFQTERNPQINKINSKNNIKIKYNNKQEDSLQKNNLDYNNIKKNNAKKVIPHPNKLIKININPRQEQNKVINLKANNFKEIDEPISLDRPNRINKIEIIKSKKVNKSPKTLNINRIKFKNIYDKNISLKKKFKEN